MFSYKEIIAYSKGYRISKCGDIINKNGVKVVGYVKRGYRQFGCKYKGKMFNVGVHRLQAYQKYQDRIFDEDVVVRHLNGNSLDNSFDNIEIGTARDNAMDIPSDRRLSRSIYAASFQRKVPDEIVKEIIEDRNNGYTYKELISKYGHGKSFYSYLFNKAYYVDKLYQRK